MADYVFEPLDTDPEQLFQDFVEHMQSFFPDWTPSEGQLDVIIARYFSQQAAFTADMASRVQRAIYRYFGSNLVGVPPLPGATATALINFHINDPDLPAIDRVLPFGTMVGLTDSDGDVLAFSTIDDTDVPAGTSDVQVSAQAVEVGANANGITGTVEPVEQIDWIDSAYVVGYSSGGADPEDDDVYIQRLTDNLALMAPRPILASDFATFARNLPGVWRAAVIDNFGGGSNTVQVILTDSTAGFFTLSWNGAGPTVAIPFSPTATQVYNALVGLPNIEPTDIIVTGASPLPDVISIEFVGRYGYSEVPLMTYDISSLTGVEFSVAESVAGAPYNTTTENSIAISAIDEAGNPLDATTKSQLIDYLQSTRAQNFTITFIDPTYHIVDVNYTARAFRYQDPASVRTLADISLQAYLNPQNWGRVPFQSDNRTWFLQPNIRYLELTTIIENTSGVDYTEGLTFSLDGGPTNSADKVLGGVFSLVRYGTIAGVINLPI